MTLTLTTGKVLTLTDAEIDELKRLFAGQPVWVPWVVPQVQPWSPTPWAPTWCGPQITRTDGTGHETPHPLGGWAVGGAK